MNEQITQLLERYKDGVPVKIDTGTILSLSAATILTVAVCAVILKYIKQL
jgi:hypothetical protein